MSISEELRPVEELQTVTDCVEEILIAVKKAYAMASLPLPSAKVEEVGYSLYETVEAIIKRAQELPREDAAGSPSPPSIPAQPA